MSFFDTFMVSSQVLDQIVTLASIKGVNLSLLGIVRILRLLRILRLVRLSSGAPRILAAGEGCPPAEGLGQDGRGVHPPRGLRTGALSTFRGPFHTSRIQYIYIYTYIQRESEKFVLYMRMLVDDVRIFIYIYIYICTA